MQPLGADGQGADYVQDGASCDHGHGFEGKSLKIAKFGEILDEKGPE